MTTIRLRRALAAAWAAANHVLQQGEIGLELDTGRFKIGDGATPYNSLAGYTDTLGASTGIAGFALQNATPNILSWTAPNDGLLHRVTCVEIKHCTVAETGGAVSMTFTGPDGSSTSVAVDAGGRGIGLFASSTLDRLVQAGSTTTVAQSSALTAGTSLVWAELWGH